MKSNSKETDRIKEPSKLAVKFANTVFVLVILFSVLVTVYAVYRIYNKPEYITSTLYYSFLLFSVLSVTLFVLGLRKLRDNLKVNMSVLLITVGISVYGFETYLELSREDPDSHLALQKKTAEQMGLPYDTRTKKEVIEDLIESGVKAYPNVHAKKLEISNELNNEKEIIYTFGGISNITTVLNNEFGFYPIIETDEHGFNNPKGLYRINKVDVMLTGDSFTEGYSVHSDETISAVLRKKELKSISIGKAATGPLLQLAILKEYAEPFKPKILLWIYFTNDLGNLDGEMESTLLKKYLNEDDFTQNLISRQEEIDSLLVDYVGDEIKRLNEYKRKKIFRFIVLSSLRNMIKLTARPPPSPSTAPVFKEILLKAKYTVSGWGGKMYFVYLPHYRRYSTGNEKDNREREFVLHTVSELDIPIIDIHREVFVPHPDPFSLFPFRLDNHYNAYGYRLVAEAIYKKLKADGIIPLNSRN